jgi:glycerophosphoryl diester phosphodiesterase
MKNCKPIAHQGKIDGDEAGIVGNTRKAFEVCLKNFPDADVEIDVRLTWTGLLLVAHDNVLQSSTNGQGFVHEVTPGQLADLRVRDAMAARWVTTEPILQLEDVLLLFKGRGGTLHLDLKCGPGDPPGVVDAVVDVLRKYPDQKVSLSPSNHPDLARVPAHYPIGILSNVMLDPDIVTYANRFTADGQRPLDKIAFHPEIWNLTDEQAAKANSAGMAVNAYTVPPFMFRWAYDHGVNLITNHFRAAMEFLEAQQRTSSRNKR